jgi:hypothetical protein
VDARRDVTEGKERAMREKMRAGGLDRATIEDDREHRREVKVEGDDIRANGVTRGREKDKGRD